MHVLGLYDQVAYVSAAVSGDGNVFANSTFVAYLIEHEVLCEKSDPDPGDIILYFREGSPAHAGIIVGEGRVVSKWGIGNLYEHNVYEVPEKYGQEIRYYQPVTVHTALEHFLEYAAQHGAFES
jgi:hypothetical protein